MTIEQMLNKLYICSNKRCSLCKYSSRNDNCKESLIEDLANDCRQIAESFGDADVSG